MSDAVDIWEKPGADEIYMLAGWRQWADAGSVSSGLPEYLIERAGAREIGALRPDGFYIFQVPGTHDLMRPVVRFQQGYPEQLETQSNKIFYTGDNRRGLVIFLGDEPHLDIERYTAALLEAARALGVKRIVGLGGVYGELPYDKERTVSGTYSLPELKEEMAALAVNLSDYQGGASIGSFVCRRAGDQGLEYVSFYAFVPSYDFSESVQFGNGIRIETDYTAWLNVMRRVNHMLRLGFDLSDLEEKSASLMELMDSRIEEMDGVAPQLGLREHLNKLSEEFNEITFNPLDEIWEDELRRLMDKFDEEEE